MTFGYNSTHNSIIEFIILVYLIEKGKKCFPPIRWRGTDGVILAMPTSVHAKDIFFKLQ